MSSIFQMGLQYYHDNSDWLNEPFLVTFLAYFMIISGAITFSVEQFLKVSAAYGRFAHTFSTQFSINSKVGWIVQEAPSFIIAVYYLSSAESRFFNSNPRNRLLLMLFSLHYFHRSFIFPMFTKPKRPNPFITHVLGFIFCVWNGYLQGASLSRNELSSSSTFYYLGLVIFWTGAIINIKSDYYLISLRTKRDRKIKNGNGNGSGDNEKTKRDDDYATSSRTSDYIMPEGGFFDFVSCPNYFGETLEWFGYALASGCIGQWAFAFFTFANLAPRAVQYHQFYKTNFKNYPKQRKAYIPFVW